MKHVDYIHSNIYEIIYILNLTQLNYILRNNSTYRLAVIYINECEPEMKNIITYKVIFILHIRSFKIIFILHTKHVYYIHSNIHITYEARQLHTLYTLDPPRLIYNISDPRAIYRPRRSRVPIYCPRVRHIVCQPRGSPTYDMSHS